jgi:cystathionine beta-lyase family protein involved in aluminum resistance
MNQIIKLSGGLAAFLLFCGLTTSIALAQSTTETATESSESNLVQKSDQVTQDVRDEIAAILDNAGETFGGLETKELYGIGAGVIVGALVSDALGGSGLVTIGVMLAGGVMGNWAANEWF